MNCIQMKRLERRLPAELGSNHTRFCTYCDGDATWHVNVGHWCGNVCEKHVKRFLDKTVKTVEEGVFVVAKTEGSAERV